MNVYHRRAIERAVLWTLTILGAVALSGCSTSRPSMIVHPSSRKSEVDGYLATAEKLMGDKYDKSVRMVVSFTPGVKYTARHRWELADGTCSYTRRMSGSVEVFYVTDPAGVLQPEVGVHEMGHAIQYSKPKVYSDDTNTQHQLMWQRGFQR